MFSLRSEHTDLEFALEVARADSWEMDLSEGTLTFSDRWAAHMGYQSDEIVHSMEAVQSLVHPDDLQQTFDDLQAYLSGRTNIYQTECRIRKKDGQYLWLLSRGKAVAWDDAGVPVKLVGTNFDITERKTYEQEKEVTLELLRLLHEENSLQELMELISRIMQKWSGCEAVGIRLNDGEDFPYYETKGFPDDFVLTERSLCAYDENGTIIRDDTGNPVLECMCGNIIRGRFDPSLPFFTSNGSFWTNSTTQLLASTSEEDRQARTRNRCNGEGYESVALIPLKTSHEMFGLIQFNDHAKDKFAPNDIELYERLAASIALGLSQRKAVQEVHEKERTIRAILNASKAVIFLIDRDGVIVECNTAMLDRFQKTTENIIGSNVWDLLPSHINQKQKKLVKQVFITGQPASIEENRDGIWTETTVYPVFDSNDKISHVTVSAVDITERKNAENHTKEAEKRLHERNTFIETILAYLPIGLAVHNSTDDQALYINKNFANIYGWPKEKLDSVEHFFECVYPDPEYRQKIVAQIVSDIQSGDPGRMVWNDIQVTTQDGSMKYVVAHNIPLPEQDLMISTVMDVTARKLAEEALRESEERFRRYFELGLIGMAITSLDKGWVEYNDTLCDMLGYTRAEFSKLTWAEMTHPEDIELELDLFDSVLAGERNGYSIEKRFIHKDGNILTTELSVYAIRKDDGSADYFLALIHNITERKQADQDLLWQQRIISLNNQIAQVFLTSPQQSIYSDVLDVILEAFESTFGYFGYLNDDGDLICASMTNTVWDRCEIEGKDIVFPHPTWGGIWGESLKKKKTIIKNDTLKLPEGHVILENAMAVSIIHHDELIGQFVVSNKPGGYTDYDRELLENVASQTAPVLHALLENSRQKTEHEKLEEQFRQAQKMEAVGRLAGGVAHDFNNMLGVILGNTELAMKDIDPSSPTYEDLQEIQKAAERSSNLTRQLLAFARKQTITPQVLDLNDTIEGMLKMLRRLIGEDIELVWAPGDKLWPVEIDPGQLDQILANLCVNSRDAISDIGSIVIETKNTIFDEHYCEDHPGARCGDFVMLALSDSGHGMDGETLEKAFEPFYTTKQQGEGTGLGLATVYGIIKQNDGFINLYSELEHGTTLKVYLPRFVGKDEQHQDIYSEHSSSNGHETILLVEDESSLLRLGIKTLNQMGYHVLAAGSPGEAIQIASNHSDAIHLLLTDVIMPEMNGRELARQILSMYPDIKCMFMSGYTTNVIVHRGVLDKGIHFIQKPYSRAVLAQKVREVLDDINI